jgi:hypothetical protein
MLLRFIYVVKHEELEYRVKNDLPYIERMSGFFKWWLNKNFGLHYDTLTDVLAVEHSLFRRIRFGLSDLIEHHRKKDKTAYHVYLAYFKPLISDCSVGYFVDNFGLFNGQIIHQPIFTIQRGITLPLMLTHLLIMIMIMMRG